jgi:MotA/TolQ/ExbB proton channel family
MKAGFSAFFSNRSVKRTTVSTVEPVWMEWLVLCGLVVFSTWLLGVRGVWALLLSSDPTGITLIIIVVFFTSTLWCGARARELQRQRNLMRSSDTSKDVGWAADYLSQLAARPADANVPMDLLMDHTHGPHSTAWWVNGIQLKLGLLGKVIGFSILALQIGQLQNFDASQSQDLLRSLTTGLGVALLTTMVGLVGNILLGLQLTRLDRYADALVADIQRAGLVQDAKMPKP